MSIISSLRNSIANFIAADRAPAQLIMDNSKSLTIANAPEHVLTQHQRATQPEVLKGKFYVVDLPNLASDRSRNAIATLGCWSALARAFSEYERVVGHKHLNDAKLTQLVDEFHAWNASGSANGYMNTEDIFEAVAKMSVVNPPKGSAETDAILARVKKVSVESIRADRIKKAEVKTAARIEMIEGFVSMVDGYQGSDFSGHHMSAAKALDKILQTLEWVAGWDSNNPAEQAAELLLIEDDLKTVRKLASQEMDNTEEYSEGVMAADTLERNINRKDDHRRVGESGKGSVGYEEEPMEKAMAEIATAHSTSRRRIRAAA